MLHFCMNFKKIYRYTVRCTSNVSQYGDTVATPAIGQTAPSAPVISPVIECNLEWLGFRY